MFDLYFPYFILHSLFELVQYTYASFSRVTHLLNSVLKCSVIYDKYVAYKKNLSKLRLHPTCEILQRHSSPVFASLNSTEFHHF